MSKHKAVCRPFRYQCKECGKNLAYPQKIDKLVCPICGGTDMHAKIYSAKTGHYVRVGRIRNFKNVLNTIKDHWSKRDLDGPDSGLIVQEFFGHKVRMYSARYKLFKKNSTCVTCGLEASFLAVEKHNTKNRATDNPNDIYHLNLYGITTSNEEVMFTKDHIIPKSQGGHNSLINYQTMCLKCNAEKADKLL